MLITCNNKGCFKSSNALLNEETKEVVCGICGKPIANISEAMRRTLKSFGQIVRLERKAFMLACKKCNANREVVLTQDNKTVCKTCHNPINVHPAFKLAMEEAGGLDKISVDAATEEKPNKKVSRKKVQE